MCHKKKRGEKTKKKNNNLHEEKITSDTLCVCLFLHHAFFYQWRKECQPTLPTENNEVRMTRECKQRVARSDDCELQVKQPAHIALDFAEILK